MPFRILHASDLHFGKHYEPGVGERFVAAAHRLAPDLIAISGDLTQRAKPREFEAAAAFLEALPDVPRVVVPGNHDVPLFRPFERLRAPLALFRHHVGTPADTSLITERCCIVGIDSTDPYRAIKNGRISGRQIQYFAEAFSSAAPHLWRVLVLHHHLIPAPSFDGPGPMPKAKRLLDALTAVGVEVVLSGHLHRGYVGNSLDVYAGKRRDSGIVVIQCGTTTSRRGRGYEREKNSFNLVELDDDAISIQHLVHFSGPDDFDVVSRHTFARPGRRSPRLSDGRQP